MAFGDFTAPGPTAHQNFGELDGTNCPIPISVSFGIFVLPIDDGPYTTSGFCCSVSRDFQPIQNETASYHEVSRIVSFS